LGVIGGVGYTPAVIYFELNNLDRCRKANEEALGIQAAFFKEIMSIRWDTPIQLFGGHWHIRDCQVRR
jgi:hypothetical protein